MPSPFIYQDDDAMELHLVKRSQLSPWVYKRNPALCDYRLQLRPLPFTAALCAYSRQHKEDDNDNHEINPFKYG